MSAIITTKLNWFLKLFRYCKTIMSISMSNDYNIFVMLALATRVFPSFSPIISNAIRIRNVLYEVGKTRMTTFISDDQLSSC